MHNQQMYTQCLSKTLTKLNSKTIITNISIIVILQIFFWVFPNSNSFYLMKIIFVYIFLVTLGFQRQTIQWDGSWMSGGCISSQAQHCCCIPNGAIFSFSQVNHTGFIPIENIEEEQELFWEEELACTEAHFYAPINLSYGKPYEQPIIFAGNTFMVSAMAAVDNNSALPIINMSYSFQDISCLQSYQMITTIQMENPEQGCWNTVEECRIAQQENCPACICENVELQNTSLIFSCLEFDLQWVWDVHGVLAILASLCSCWVMIDIRKNRDQYKKLIFISMIFICLGDINVCNSIPFIISKVWGYDHWIWCFWDNLGPTIGAYLVFFWSYSLALMSYRLLSSRERINEARFIKQGYFITIILILITLIPLYPQSPISFFYQDGICQTPNAYSIGGALYLYSEPLFFFILTAFTYWREYNYMRKKQYLSRKSINIFFYPFGQLVSYSFRLGMKWVVDKSDSFFSLEILETLPGFVNLLLYWIFIRKSKNKNEEPTITTEEHSYEDLDLQTEQSLNNALIL